MTPKTKSGKSTPRSSTTGKSVRESDSSRRKHRHGDGKETDSSNNPQTPSSSATSKKSKHSKKDKSEVVSVDITTETTANGKTTTTHRRKKKVDGKMQEENLDDPNQKTLKEAVDGKTKKKRRPTATKQTKTEETKVNADGTTSTITKTVTVSRRRRKPVKRSGANAENAEGAAGGKRKRRRRPARKIVKKVVIRKHHHRHAKQSEEPDPEPIIKRVKRKGKKKRGTKKIVKKVIIRKKGGKGGDAAQEADAADAKKKRRVRRGKKKVVQYITVIKTRINPKTGKKEQYEEKVPVTNDAAAEGGGKKRRRRRPTKAGEGGEGTGKKKRVVKRRRGKKIITRIIKIVRKRKDPKTGKEEIVEEPIQVKATVNPTDSLAAQQAALDKAAIETVQKAQDEADKKSKKKGPRRKVVRKVITIIRKVVNPETGKEDLVEEKRLVEAEVPDNVTPEQTQETIDNMVLEATTKAAEAEEAAAQKKNKKRPKKRIVHKFIKIVRKVVNPETGKEELVEEKKLVAAPVDEDLPPENALEAIQDVAKAAVIQAAEEEKAQSPASATSADTKVQPTFVNVVQRVKDPATGEEHLVEEMKLVAAQVHKDASPDTVAQEIEQIAQEAQEKADEEQDKAENSSADPKKRKKRPRRVHRIIKIVRKRYNPETGKEEVIEEKKMVSAEIDDATTPEQIADIVEKLAMDANTQAQEEHEEAMAQLEAKKEGEDIVVVRKRRRKKRPVVVQKVIKIIKKRRNPKTGKEELVTEKQVVAAELPPESPPEAANAAIQQLAKEAIIKAAEESAPGQSDKKVIPDFVTVVKKQKDPETGKEKLVEEMQLVAAEVPKDTPPEEANHAIEELAAQAINTEAANNGDVAPGNKLAHNFVTVMQKEVNPLTGEEEIVEKKQLVTTEVPQNAPPEVAQEAIEKVAAELLEKQQDEINAQIDPEKEVEVTEVDKATGKVVKKKVKPKKKRVVHKFVTIVKKRVNPVTGKEEIHEEKRLVAAALPEDAPPQAAQDAIEKVAADAVEKQQQDQEDQEALAKGEAEIDKTTGKIIRKKKTKPKKRVVHKFVTIVKKKPNPKTGKEELVEEKQLVTAEVDLQAPPEVAQAAIESIAAEAIQKEAEEKEKEEDKAALAAGETDEARKKRKAKKKRIVHNFVTVVKKRVNPETGKEELVEEKQLVAAEVANDAPEEQANAIIEKLAAEHVEKIAEEEQKKEEEALNKAMENADPETKKKMKPRKKKKVVHNFVTIVKKKVNPETGKEELVEEKQLVAAEVPEDIAPEEAQKEIENMAAEAVTKAMEDNQAEKQKVNELAQNGKAEEQPKLKVVHNFVDVTRQRVNPDTGKKETYKEKQLVAVEVPIEVPPEEANKKLEEVKKEQAQREKEKKKSPIIISKNVPIKKRIVDPETGEEKEYVDQVPIVIPEDDKEAEKEETKKLQDKADQDYQDQKAIWLKNKADKEAKMKEEEEARRKAEEEERRKKAEEEERIKKAEEEAKKRKAAEEEDDYEEEEEIEETQVIVQYSSSSSEPPPPPKKPKQIIHEYYYEEDEEEEVEVHNITVYVDDENKVLETDTKVQGQDGKEVKGNNNKYGDGTKLDDLMKQLNVGDAEHQEIEYDDQGQVVIRTLQQGYEPKEPFDPAKYNLPPDTTLEKTPEGYVLVQKLKLKPGEDVTPEKLQGLQLASIKLPKGKK